MLRYNDRIFNIYYLTIENPKPPNAKRHRIGKFGANILFFFIFFLPYPQLLICIVISTNMVPRSFRGPHWAKFLKNILKIFKCSKFRKYKIYFDTKKLNTLSVTPVASILQACLKHEKRYTDSGGAGQSIVLFEIHLVPE